jgi:hypothetical protein
VEVVGDLRRRVIGSRLEPNDEAPHKRTDLRYPDLPQWVTQHRAELLAATLTLWRHWIAEGRPHGHVKMGSFDRWADAVGGCLEAAGIEGFLSNTSQWLDEGDPEEVGWKIHLSDLARLHRDRPFTVKDIANLVGFGGLDFPAYTTSAKDLSHLIGNAYRGVRGRWFGDYRLVTSTTNNAANGAKTWKVECKAPEHPSTPRRQGARLRSVSSLSSLSEVSSALTSASETPETPDSPITTNGRVEKRNFKQRNSEGDWVSENRSAVS